MKIASWNVNSIKARKDHVKKWLQEIQPDILGIQELKGLDFPANDFEEIGYHSEAVTQKAYNGVAVFSKEKQILISDHLYDDENARFIEIEYKGVRVLNCYMPNGNPTGTEKFDYKMKWMEHLLNKIKSLRENGISFVLTGDFNIIPEDEDCYSPNAWKDDALFHEKSRGFWYQLKNLGLYDAFRIYDQSPQKYTFWDYQGGAWPKNNGIRIDHFLLTPDLTDKLVSCEINTAPRSWEKASDHTPIMIELDI
ncbi:MAG: exodeoxyribonuclease III [Pseudomonadota bacterium]